MAVLAGRRAPAPDAEPPRPRRDVPAAPRGHRGPRGHKPRRQYGLHRPTLRRALGIEVAAVLVCTLAIALRIPSTTVAVVVIPLALLPFVVVAGRSLLDWAFTAIRYTTKYAPPTGVTSEHIDDDGTPIGIHRIGERVSCVLELRPASGVATRLGRSSAITDSSLDIGVLADQLVQHDISLSGVTVVGHGARSASGSPATDVYEDLIGPLPAVATRTVWIVVTLEARANELAAHARGGGTVGMDRTATIATRRVARALDTHGITSRLLSRSGVQSTAAHMLRGVSVDSLDETWRAAKMPGVIRTGFGLDCRALDAAGLADLWAVPALSTTVVIRLTPTARQERIALDGSCGFVTRTHAPTAPLPGALSMNGRQRQALLTSLPLSIEARGSSDSVCAVTRAHASELQLPVAGCGQLVGSDSSGHGVALRIHGSDVASVHVVGELYLAQQLVFRAIAVGARVLVRTDRPHAWGPMVDSVATPDKLRIDGGHHRAGTRIELVVHDFSSAVDALDTTRNDGVTVLTLTEHIPATPMPDPDVSIVQPGAAGDRVLVRTPNAELDLVLVTIPRETAFIGRPRSLRQATNAYRPG